MGGAIYYQSDCIYYKEKIGRGQFIVEAVNVVKQNDVNDVNVEATVVKIRLKAICVIVREREKEIDGRWQCDQIRAIFNGHCD